jgi:hypothetical protein
MDLNDEPCIISPSGKKPGPACSLPGPDIYYCDAKGKVCLTGCAYCRNTCPCQYPKGVWMGWFK